MGAVFLALAGRPAFAEQGAVPRPSPEAAPNFGEPGEASPLLAVFEAARGARDPAPEPSVFDGPKHDLEGPATAASQEPAPPESPAVVYDPTAGPPLSPMQRALQAATARLIARAERRNPLGAGDWRAARRAIAAFYAARAYEPVWVGENGLTEAGRSALSQLGRAHDDGLDLSAFALPRALKTGLTPDALAEAETTIASAVAAYAGQATGSRVPPSRVSPYIFLVPAVADPGAALAKAAGAADPAQALADFNPPQRGYRDLREALAGLDAPIGDAERRAPIVSADLDPGATALLGGGESGRRMRPAARERIRAASAGAMLARERGGVIANMEMWRWEPRDMGEKRIEINVPDFSVAALDGDAVLFQARAIVGKPTTPTALFSSLMRTVVINPSWRVPDSIIKKEMMSKVDSLSRRGYEVKTVKGRLTVRQLPGEDNALGRIAFMFPNDHAIYLHDTPARELFDEETRAFSHGCIRVEDPVRLAALVLEGESGRWTEERIEASFGTRERVVFLPRPLPVHIEYFTEFVDKSGELRERPDVYGWARRVEGALARESQD